MLKVMVTEEKFFDIDTFNSRLHTTELGYMEAKDCPTIIARNTLMSDGHSLKQNGEILPCPAQYALCLCMHGIANIQCGFLDVFFLWLLVN